MRLDKWLWAARFFKTRTLAAKACELGRVQLHDQNAKPARELKLGDRLTITAEAGVFAVEVRELSEVRGPAAAAQQLYHESEAAREERLRIAAERRTHFQFLPAPSGRPSKQDRRRIRDFRGR